MESKRNGSPLAAFAGAPALAVTALLLAGSAAGVRGETAARSGQDVYRHVCSACHATGVEKAPQFGDREAWKPLIEEGQHVLTAHAWVGVRAMPPRGGDPTLSLEAFARATAYMARAAGGDWKDPDAAMLQRIRNEEAARLRSLRERGGQGPGHD